MYAYVQNDWPHHRGDRLQDHIFEKGCAGLGKVHSNTAAHHNTGIKLYHQDLHKVQSTLKCIARYWCSEGADEKEQSYRPIIEAIEEFYKPGGFEVNEVKILVTGAGLARLLYELSCRGHEYEDNESHCT